MDLQNWGAASGCQAGLPAAVAAPQPQREGAPRLPQKLQQQPPRCPCHQRLLLGGSLPLAACQGPAAAALGQPWQPRGQKCGLMLC